MNLMQNPPWPTIGDPVLVVALTLALVLLVPLLGRRLRLPDVVALVLAGVAVGPHGLALLARDGTMVTWGTMGVLYIMFLAGLETDVQDFIRHRHRALLFGWLSFIVPQAVGAVLAHHWFGYGWPASLLIGSMLASFTLLTYPQIVRLGLARHEPVVITVGGTLITDTLALLVLAVIAEASRRPLTPLFALRMAASFGAFLAIVLLGVPRLSRWFFLTVARDGGLQFLFVLVTAFLCAALSHLAGVEAIIGAFLAGLTLGRVVPRDSVLMNRLQFVGQLLFIPFFLLSTGMLVNLRALAADRHSWAVGGFMTLAVIVTKYWAARLTQRALGYTRDDGWVIFSLSVPQAAATLAAVMVGYQLGILELAVLNGAIMMVLVTCLISPLVADRYGRRLALRLDRDAETPRPDQGRMLIPLHHPDSAGPLVELTTLCGRFSEANPLYALRVIPESEADDAAIANAEKLLLRAGASGSAAGLRITPVIRAAPSAAAGIEQVARELRVNTVTLGWSRRGVIGLAVLGGVLDDILAACPARLLVCRLARPLNTVRRIALIVPPLVEHEPGFDGSLALIHQLVQRLRSRPDILVTHANQAAARAAWESLRPETSAQWLPHASWSALRALSASGLPGYDLVVLLSGRVGTPSWQPAMDRLPRWLGENDPQRNVVVVYAPLPVATSASATNADALTLGVELVGVRRAESDRLLSDLLPLLAGDLAASDDTEPSEEDLGDMAARLRCSVEQFPIELAPGIVLLHGRTVHLERVRLAVMFLPVPQVLPGCAEPARLLLALLGPEGQDPQAHLRLLGRLAGLAKDMRSLIGAAPTPTPAELLAWLRDKLAAPSPEAQG